MPRLRWRWTLGLVLPWVVAPGAPAAGARSLELRTREVTDPDLAIAPDGRSLIFSLLGHLFRMPVEGGRAEQLTFGPSYDNEPAFAPDGRRVAFVSDRDGSGGNVFVLDLETRALSPLTHEVQAAQPTWSPDGRSLAYCRVLPREEHPARLLPRFFGSRGLRELRRISLPAGDPEVVASPCSLGSIAYLADGRLAWVVIEPVAGPGGGPFGGRSNARIEVMGPDGKVSRLRAVEGDPGRVIVSPSGDGLYGSAGGLRFLPLPDGPARPVLAPSGGRAGGSFVIAPDNKGAYMGQDGQIVHVAFADGARRPVAFEARVTLEVPEPIRPHWSPAEPADQARFRSVMSPRLSPDGRRLVFQAAGDLWGQPMPDGPATRLLDRDAFRRDPAFSPDGRLAFAENQAGTRRVRVLDVESRQGRTLATLGDRSWGLLPSWSRDGERLVFQRSDSLSMPIGLILTRLGDGSTSKVADATAGWTARPHFAGDGKALYFTGRTENLGTLYRLLLTPGAKPVAVTDLAGHVSDALVSDDGKWLAFRRNAEIWVAPMGEEPIKEDRARRLSPEGGRNFAFTPDGTALIYAAGPRVWRQPLAGGDREEVPVRVDLRRPEPPTVLVRRVRVLKAGADQFTTETSMLLAAGRIRWIGAEGPDHPTPQSAVILDAEGRFAIPGLFDLHVHSAWADSEANPDAFLAFGITSVRDTGGRLDLLNALADRGDLTADPLPRYFFSGEIFEGARPNWGDAFLQITDAEEARAHVRLWHDRGAHFIKVYPSLPWPLQRVVAEEARRLALPVVGHGLSTEEIVKSVTLGYAVLEHGPSSIGDDVLQLLAEAGTRWDPTLAVMGGHQLLIRAEPGRLDEATFRAFVPEASIREAKGGGLFGRMPENMLRAGWKARLDRIRAAHDRGVKLQAGTDALMTGTFFGPSLHWELEHFVEAGLTPREAIRMATADAASAVGAADDLGSIAEGKLADLVLLAADPLAKIQNTRSIWRVIKAGRVFDPETLRAGGRQGGAATEASRPTDKAP